MKVFITKYALTQGIIEADARGVGDGMVVVRGRFDSYFRKDDWHDNIIDAVDAANRMRTKKITSLKKQLDKLEHMLFTEV